MKFCLVIFLAIGAVHCQQQCRTEEDIDKIIEAPQQDRELKVLVGEAEVQVDILNRTLSKYKPDDPAKDTGTRCCVAIIGNIFNDIDLHVDDKKWEISESTLRQYESLEKSMSESSSARVKRGLFGFFKKVVKGVVKIAKTIVKVVTVIKKVVEFANTIISIIKDIKVIFGFFGK